MKHISQWWCGKLLLLPSYHQTPKAFSHAKSFNISLSVSPINIEQTHTSKNSILFGCSVVGNCASSCLVRLCWTQLIVANTERAEAFKKRMVTKGNFCKKSGFWKKIQAVKTILKVHLREPKNWVRLAAINFQLEANYHFDTWVMSAHFYHWKSSKKYFFSFKAELTIVFERSPDSKRNPEEGPSVVDNWQLTSGPELGKLTH